MSNNNNVYSGARAPAEALNNNSETTISIESDLQHPLLPQSEEQHLEEEDSLSTSINMESSGGTSTSSGGRTTMQRNFMSLFNEARTQLGRQTSYPGASMATAEHQQTQFGSRVLSPRGENIPNSFAHTSSNNSGGNSMPQSPSGSGGRPPQSRQAIRSWRMNLNDVLSFSSAPSTEALRSLITHSGSFRYTPLSTSENVANAGDNIHLLLREQEPRVNASSSSTVSGFRASAPTLRSNSLREDVSFGMPQSLSMSAASGVPTTTPPPATMPSSFSTSPIAGRVSISEAPRHHHHHASGTASTTAAGGNNNGTTQAATTAAATAAAAAADMDEDNNVISDMLVKVLSHFVRYLPFIGILFIKFIHDHLLGILDILLLHGIMYQVNKSLREQIAKFSQKSYAILFRDFGLVAFVVAYRFVLAASYPDPFGLLIAPPSEVTIAVTSITKNGGGSLEQVVASSPASASEVLSQYFSQLTAKPQPSVTSDSLGNTVTVTKAISLGVLLYYVAVNDLILKLITILIKISITMMPTKVIRHKPRARMYVLVEYFSQFYRSLAPLRQWLIFLFESYSGLEVISGILFSSIYIGVKGFEFVERGKSLKKALINFVRNMDYERKPTKDELDAAGTVCPICHDTYSTPVVLECGHIFCDDCVSTWFKREQTCPMCRAKVSEDPTWQDGGTTFFYQLC